MSALSKLLLSIVVLAITTALPATSIAKPKQYDQIGVDGDVKIELEKGYKCKGPAPVRVSAPTSRWFESEAVRFQRLIGVARIALSFDCPKVDTIDIIGVSGSKQVYQGQVSQSGGWIVLPANPGPRVETKLAKAVPAEPPQRQKIQHPNRGDLGGLWYGHASCGKGRNHKTKPAQVVFTLKKNGRYTAVAEINDLRGGTVTLPFTASKGKMSRGRQTYNAKGKRVNNTVGGFDFVSGIARADLLDEKPRHIAVKTVGRCKFISAARFVKLPGLSGEYANWNTPASLCSGLKEWLGGAKSELELISQWTKKVPDFVTGVKFVAGAKTAIFDDTVFRKLFGVSIKEIDTDTYRKLIVQVGECATFPVLPDKKIFRKNIDAYVTKYGFKDLKGMVIPNLRRVRKYHAGKLTLNPTLAQLKELHEQRRVAAEKIAAVSSQLNQTTSLGALNTLTQNSLKDLALLPPSSLKPIIESARLHRSQLQVKVEALVQAPTEKLLAKRTTPFYPSDALAGHTLLASAFGHAIYVENVIAQGEQCPRQVPVRVQLASLLPLKHYENRSYGKQFFFYALNALDSMCGWPSDDKAGRGWKIRAHFYFDDEPVGQLSLRRNDYNVYASDANMQVNGWARNVDHPNYVYDVAFSTMLGGLTDRHDEQIRALTWEDLDKLSQAGDLLAALHLSFDRGANRSDSNQATTGRAARRLAARARSSYSSGTANVELSIDLGSLPRDANPKRLREASARGSVAASQLLAMQLGLKSGMMRSPMTAKSISFEELPKAQQNDFVLWAAKAKQGRVYWSVFLNEAIDGWQIDLQPGIDAIAKNGFAASEPVTDSSPSTEVSFAEQATTEATPDAEVELVVEQNWTQVALSEYHVNDCELAAQLLTEQPLQADGNWQARAQTCVFLLKGVGAESGATGTANSQMSVSVGQVTHRECSGDDAEQTCEIAYSVVCEATDGSSGRGVSSSDGLAQLRRVCVRLNAFPLSIFATFERGADKRWKVVGEVLKM